MAVKQSTRAMRDALRTPRVLQFAQFRTECATYRQVICRVSEQASVLQQALAAMEADEDNPLVLAKVESLRQTLRAAQRQHDAAEKAYSTLAQTMRQLEREAAEFAEMVEKAEAVAPDAQ